MKIKPAMVTLGERGVEGERADKDKFWSYNYSSWNKKEVF